MLKLIVVCWILYVHLTSAHHHDRYRHHHDTYDLCQLDVNQHHIRNPLRSLNGHHKRHYRVVHHNENKESRRIKILKSKKRKNTTSKNDDIGKIISNKERKLSFHRSKGRRHRNLKIKKTTPRQHFTTTSFTGDTESHSITETSTEELNFDILFPDRKEKRPTQGTTEYIRLYKSIHERPITERSPHQYLAPDISSEWYS